MNIASLRNQFSLYVLGDADQRTELQASLNQAGYQSSLFTDVQSLIQKTAENPPHIILFSLKSLEGSLSEFVQAILQGNSEILFICVASIDQASALSQYREYNFAGFVAEGADLAVRALWQVDQTCENLVRTYQGEELVQFKQAANREISELRTLVKDLQAKNRSLSVQTEKSGVGTLTEKAKAYEGLTSKEDFLSAFLRRIPGKAIYFKFLPSVNSFVAVSGNEIDIENIQGIGARMSSAEAADPMAILNSGKLPDSLAEIMTEGLKIPSYHVRPIAVHGGLEGLFVFWGEEGFDFKEVENEFVLFLLFYQRAHLQKLTESLEIIDSVTELHNRTYFYQKIEEEIARARRLKKAVSVVRMSIDHLTEIEQSLGTHHRDVVLKTVGTIIKKTSRVNDISCRTEDNQISLILPHCSRRGAALRAERLRRIIETHVFSTMDLKVTVSSGVSEYPSLSNNSLELDASATKALEFIIDKGGNKVCLYKPAEEFKPEFEVAP